MAKNCYVCGRHATTKEHFPPKCFFPKKANLQLTTVPSCPEHNNQKSHDDQYFLAQVLMNAAKGNNLPKRRFLEAISPQLKQSPKFKKMLAKDSVDLGGGAVAYPVDVARMMNVMDGICHAIIFYKYGVPLNTTTHRIHHEFLSFMSSDEEHERFLDCLMSGMTKLTDEHSWAVSDWEADKQDEVVYSYKLIAPAGTDLSITIIHNFYGVFDVVSLMTKVA